MWKNINNWNGICYSLWTLLPSTITIKWKWKKIVTARSHTQTHTQSIFIWWKVAITVMTFLLIYFRFPRIVTIQLVRDRMNLWGKIRILRWLRNVRCGAFVTFVWFTHNTSQVCLAEMGKKSILVSRLYLAQWTKFMQCHEPTLANTDNLVWLLFEIWRLVIACWLLNYSLDKWQYPSKTEGDHHSYQLWLKYGVRWICVIIHS